ncbi:MAG: hypothetical protein ABF289_11110 [Clostridiales bacterium]
MLVFQKKNLVAVISIVVTFSTLGFILLNASSWNSANDPLNLDENYESNISKLPESSELSEIPWADTYWPSNQGGISARWDSSGLNIYSLFRNRYYMRSTFDYSPYSLVDLKSMTLNEISELSPAEKFDIVCNNFDYPTVQAEKNRCSQFLDDWEGLCDGWAQASLNFKEPKPVIFETNEGLQVPFGSSDIKALLIYYLAVVDKKEVNLLGTRCNENNFYYRRSVNSPEYNDVNAGAFHIVLTNFIGLKSKGLIADISPGYQIWNKPIFGYETTIDGENYNITDSDANGTAKKLQVTTVIKYRTESDKSWDPLYDSSKYIDYSEYRYNLELNANNEIIGGSWISKSHPDFLWQQEIPEFIDNYKIIENIYNLSQN